MASKFKIWRSQILRPSAQTLRNRSHDSKDIPSPYSSFQTTLLPTSLSNVSLVHQYVFGIFYPVLEHTPFTMDHINSLWLNDLFRFKKKYKVELKLRNNFITQRQRHNDRHLFDDILTYTSSLLSRKKLLGCRLYLHITLLSDITNIKGTTLLPNILIGARNTNIHQTFSWSLQKSPTTTLGNFGIELCEVYTVAQHLPSTQETILPSKIDP